MQQQRTRFLAILSRPFNARLMLHSELEDCIANKQQRLRKEYFMKRTVKCKQTFRRTLPNISK